ncbi:MAG: hypothetical protein JW774_09170 [Candidatus Aureabacteria bacterium]|nr:hypothetical protein [Candidatus Auribacterota bacterium]
MAQPFKRNECINNRVYFYFFLFTLVSMLVIFYFFAEEYQSAIKAQTTSLSKSYMETDIKFFPFAENLTFKNVLVFSLWLFSCFVFAVVFRPRLKIMFRLFMWLSFLVVILYNFWTVFISYAIENPANPVVSLLLNHLRFPLSSKAILLCLWGFFSIYISFSYVTTKYMGVFTRLDYLFNSIARGNWDANMFFRTNDSFAFAAKNFNELKGRYLKKIYETDEVLIQIKDKITSQDSSPELLQELKKLIKQSSILSSGYES